MPIKYLRTLILSLLITPLHTINATLVMKSTEYPTSRHNVYDPEEKPKKKRKKKKRKKKKKEETFYEEDNPYADGNPYIEQPTPYAFSFKKGPIKKQTKRIPREAIIFGGVMVLLLIGSIYAYRRRQRLNNLNPLERPVPLTNKIGTCYFNTALQALLSVDELREYIHDLANKHHKDGEINTYKLIQDFLNRVDSREFDPEAIIKELQKEDPTIGDGNANTITAAWNVLIKVLEKNMKDPSNPENNLIRKLFYTPTTEVERCVNCNYKKFDSPHDKPTSIQLNSQDHVLDIPILLVNNDDVTTYIPDKNVPDPPTDTIFPLNYSKGLSKTNFLKPVRQYIEWQLKQRNEYMGNKKVLLAYTDANNNIHYCNDDTQMTALKNLNPSFIFALVVPTNTQNISAAAHQKVLPLVQTKPFKDAVSSYNNPQEVIEGQSKPSIHLCQQHLCNGIMNTTLGIQQKIINYPKVFSLIYKDRFLVDEGLNDDFDTLTIGGKEYKLKAMAIFQPPNQNYSENHGYGYVYYKDTGWWKVNDQFVSQATKEEVLGQKPFFLVYELVSS